MTIASKPTKNKPVRDSFTMPKQEYAQISEIKQRAAKHGRPTKKSEVLRAALALLNALSDEKLVATLQSVPSIKTGRPKAQAISAEPAIAKPAAKKVEDKKAAKPAPKKTVSPEPAAKKSRKPKAVQA